MVKKHLKIREELGNDKTLTGYEFRMYVRLYETTRKIINKKSVRTILG